MPVFENEEDQRVARVLATILLAILVAGPVFIIVSVLLQEWVAVGGLAALMVALVCIWALIRRGRLLWASMVLTVAVLALVTVVITDGQGIHDVTIVVYPAVIVLASLVLQRRPFVIVTLLTIASVGWAVFGAMAGWYLPQPHTVGNPGDFINVAMVLGLTALLVYYLADNMRNSLRQAQREIADRQETEIKLRASETRFRALVEDSWEALTLLTADGRVTYESPAARRLLGYTLGERLGRSAFSVIHPSDIARGRDVFATFLRRPGQSYTTELRVRHQDGRWVWVQLALTNMLQVPEVGAVVIHARDISQRRQSEEQLRGRLAELEAVARVSTTLRGARGPDELLPLVLDEILALLATDTGSMTLHDGLRESGRNVVRRGWFTALEPAQLPPVDGVAAHVYATGQLYRTPEFAADPHSHLSAQPAFPPGWGGACVPIRAGQEIVGLMYVAVRCPRELTDDEARLLTTLAEIGGNALHRARLHAVTERDLQRLAALRAIDQAISANFDVRVSLNILLEQVTTHLGADAAAVLRLSPRTQALEFAAGHGIDNPLMTMTTLYPGAGYAERLIREQRRLSLPDLSLSAGSAAGLRLPQAGSFRAYHAVPLLAKGQVKGILEVYHHQPFAPGPDWLDLLDELAGQAAIAIDNAELFESLQQSNAELAQAYDATIEGWALALDLRERETGNHARRVTEIAVRLAQKAGITGEALVQFRRGALLHDIGKMGVPDSILLNPSSLSAEEWAIMRQHTEYAYDLLSAIAYLHPARDIPYRHHEKWDGTGYPGGLKGDAIPLAARLFAVVDVWDALRSNRPYRPSWPNERVRAYLREQAGRHFDPQFVELFLDMIGSD